LWITAGTKRGGIKWLFDDTGKTFKLMASNNCHCFALLVVFELKGVAAPRPPKIQALHQIY